MAGIVIILLAAASILWRIEPAARPFIDGGMWVLAAGLLFILGVRFDDWLTRLAARPRRRNARRHSTAKRQRSAPALSLPLK